MRALATLLKPKHPDWGAVKALLDLSTVVPAVEIITKYSGYLRKIRARPDAPAEIVAMARERLRQWKAHYGQPKFQDALAAHLRRDENKRALAAFLRRADSSLNPHHDRRGKGTKYRGSLAGLGGAHFVCWGPEYNATTSAAFTPKAGLTAADLRLGRKVRVPAGGVALWHWAALHCNCGPANDLPEYAECPSYDADAVIATPDLVHNAIEKYNVVVVTGVLTADESQSLVSACINAVKSAMPKNGYNAPPKGFGGSSLCKMYGISTFHELRRFYTVAKLLEMWRSLLGTAEICMAPDAVTFTPGRRPDGSYDYDRPQRAGLIQCFGRASDQEPGTGAMKREAYERGASFNHPPCETRAVPKSTGGVNHYSNSDQKVGNRWVPQTPRPLTDEDKDFDDLFGP